MSNQLFFYCLSATAELLSSSQSIQTTTQFFFGLLYFPLLYSGQVGFSLLYSSASSTMEKQAAATAVFLFTLLPFYTSISPILFCCSLAHSKHLEKGNSNFAQLWFLFSISIQPSMYCKKKQFLRQFFPLKNRSVSDYIILVIDES